MTIGATDAVVVTVTGVALVVVTVTGVAIVLTGAVVVANDDGVGKGLSQST